MVVINFYNALPFIINWELEKLLTQMTNIGTQCLQELSFGFVSKMLATKINNGLLDIGFYVARK